MYSLKVRRNLAVAVQILIPTMLVTLLEHEMQHRYRGTGTEVRLAAAGPRHRTLHLLYKAEIFQEISKTRKCRLYCKLDDEAGFT